MERKIELFIEDMAAHGVNRYYSYPPVFRLFEKFGFYLRPPLFRSFVENALMMGIPFGFIFGILMYLLNTSKGGETLVELMVSALAGIIFGLLTAANYARKARSLQLPSWDKYNPSKIS